MCFFIHQIDNIVSSRSLDGETSFSMCRWPSCYPRRHWTSGRGACSSARMLVRRWWIHRYSSTSLMGCTGTGSKAARDVPWSMCHNKKCLATFNGPLHRLTNPCWRCCFLMAEARRLFRRAFRQC
jgi:hypothetical protein